MRSTHKLVNRMCSLNVPRVSICSSAVVEYRSDLSVDLYRLPMQTNISSSFLPCPVRTTFSLIQTDFADFSWPITITMNQGERGCSSVCQSGICGFCISSLMAHRLPEVLLVIQLLQPGQLRLGDVLCCADQPLPRLKRPYLYSCCTRQ